MVATAQQPQSESVKRRVYRILEGRADDPLARVIELSILLLIALNVVAVILETVYAIEVRYRELFRWFEAFSVLIFTIEYLLRLWSVTESPRFGHPLWGRLRFMITPLALVDLVAILPFYLPFILPIDLRFMRAMRLIRLFRLFKISRYSETLEAIATAFRATRNDLLMTIFIILILLIMSSALMYFLEREQQPEVFRSIPHTMWWMIALLTPNVGTSVMPVTPVGKVLAAIIAILGFGVFALPAGILATGIAKTMQKQSEEKKAEPSFGKSMQEIPKEIDYNSPPGSA